MDDFATGYIAGQGDNNNSSNGMWGDGGWIFGIIILAGAAVALAASVVLGAALLTALASRGLLPAPM